MTWTSSHNTLHTTQSTISSSRAAASAMATLISVYLLMASGPSRPREHPMWSTGSVCVSTTRQAAIASTVRRCTTTGPGRQPTAEREALRSAEAANAMDTRTPVTSTLACGRRQGIAAAGSAITVSTTRRGSTASAASLASTATSADPSLPQMPAKPVPAIPSDRLSSLSAQWSSATPAMVTALASLGWQGHTVTGVWWDTGASETTAAGLVTAQGAATLSQATASAATQTWTGITKFPTYIPCTIRANPGGTGKMSKDSLHFDTQVNVNARNRC